MHGAFPTLDGDPGSDTDGVYSDFLLAGNTTDADGNRIVQDLLDEERVTQWRLSPRVGISHPISTTAKIFFNYGHMYQRPAMYDLYRIEYQTRARQVASRAWATRRWSRRGRSSTRSATSTTCSTPPCCG